MSTMTADYPPMINYTYLFTKFVFLYKWTGVKCDRRDMVTPVEQIEVTEHLCPA
jgi:hypothetical protein